MIVEALERARREAQGNVHAHMTLKRLGDADWGQARDYALKMASSLAVLAQDKTVRAPLGRHIGLIMTVQHLAGAISNIPGGILVDTVGKKGYLMAASLFWVGFPYALMSVTHNFWMLIACVTLVGIGNNLWHPAAIPTLALRYPERKGLVLSFHGMGGNLGEALAPFVVGALLAWLSWRAVVVVNVVPGIVMALLNRNGRARCFSQSTRICRPATIPPTTPNALDIVPISMSTLPCRSK